MARSLPPVPNEPSGELKAIYTRLPSTTTAVPVTSPAGLNNAASSSEPKEPGSNSRAIPPVRIGSGSVSKTFISSNPPGGSVSSGMRRDTTGCAQAEIAQNKKQNTPTSRRMFSRHLVIASVADIARSFRNSDRLRMRFDRHSKTPHGRGGKCLPTRLDRRHLPKQRLARDDFLAHRLRQRCARFLRRRLPEHGAIHFHQLDRVANCAGYRLPAQLGGAAFQISLRLKKSYRLRAKHGLS